MNQQPVQERVAATLPVDRPRIVNDFSMVVATINGSGSQTSNMALIRALFRMGVPVSGKNLFPSNIQGLPTWFTIRASSLGYTARREKVEIIVAMNPATFVEDLQTLIPGGVCFYPDHFAAPKERDDVESMAGMFKPIGPIERSPVTAMCRAVLAPAQAFSTFTTGMTPMPMDRKATCPRMECWFVYMPQKVFEKYAACRSSFARPASSRARLMASWAISRTVRSGYLAKRIIPSPMM